MNTYEANFTNTMARIGAWNRGMLRRYRRPVWAIVAASAAMAVSISAAQAPANPVVIVAR